MRRFWRTVALLVAAAALGMAPNPFMPGPLVTGTYGVPLPVLFLVKQEGPVLRLDFLVADAIVWAFAFELAGRARRWFSRHFRWRHSC